jgi:4-hydroxy-2-oxoheptanedioate aldolase
VSGLKQRLAAGERLIGSVVNSVESGLVEAIGYAGFDYVLLDAEHGSMGPSEIETMIRRADAVGLPAIVRVDDNAQPVIQRVLDAGATGVQVPQVNAAAEVEAAVRAAHFGPVGTRGLATARAGRFGIGFPLTAHIAAGEERTVVVPQIEDAVAVERVDELLAVPGPDFFFVGPSDLSQSLGHPGEAGHPEVQAAIDAVLAAGAAHGVPLGTSISSVEAAEAAFVRGYSVVTIVALGLFGEAARSFLTRLRPREPQS